MFIIIFLVSLTLISSADPLVGGPTVQKIQRQESILPKLDKAISLSQITALFEKPIIIIAPPVTSGEAKIKFFRRVGGGQDKPKEPQLIAEVLVTDASAKIQWIKKDELSKAPSKKAKNYARAFIIGERYLESLLGKDGGRITSFRGEVEISEKKNGDYSMYVRWVPEKGVLSAGHHSVTLDKNLKPKSYSAGR